MPTFTALTTLTGRDPAYALGEAMERLTPEPTGVGVFEMEDGSGLWEVGGYFEEKPDAAALAVLAKAMGAKDFSVSELPETDWVAHVRRELAPVEAGRFFVYGSHDADKVPDDCEPLLIEAAMASTAVPQPMSATFLPWNPSPARRSNARRQPSVVPWCPVPKAIAASMSSGSQSSGTLSASWLP